MATFHDLDGAFSSLQDTLQHRYSPLFPEEIGTRWLGAMAYAGTLARDTAAWNALPDPLADGDAAVARLDAAARALAATRDEAAILAALDGVDAALATLRAYLDRRP